MTIEGSASRSWSSRTIAVSLAIAAAHTPLARQRRHWAQTAVQVPYRSGRWRHWQPVRARNRIASTIWRRGIWAGAPRRSGGSNRSATSSHCSSVKAIAKLMAAIVAARDVSFDGTHPRSERELSATGPQTSFPGRHEQEHQDCQEQHEDKEVVRNVARPRGTEGDR